MFVILKVNCFIKILLKIMDNNHLYLATFIFLEWKVIEGVGLVYPKLLYFHFSFVDADLFNFKSTI